MFGALAATPSLPYPPGYLWNKMGNNSLYWSGAMSFWINTVSKPTSIDPFVTDAQFLTAAQSALATWENDAGSYFDANYAGTTTRVTHISNAALPPWNNYNDIIFDELYGQAPGGTQLDNALAYCAVRNDLVNGRIIEADIWIDITASNGVVRPWSIGAQAGRYDLQNTLTHEAGHWVGLADLSGATTVDTQQTMWVTSNMNDISKRSLEKGDLAGLRFLYGNKITVGTGVGSNQQEGADADLWDINKDGTLDLVCAWLDNPSGSNYIYYKVGWTVSSTMGTVSSWSSVQKVNSAIGSDCSGLGIAVSYIDNDVIPDILFAWVEEVTGADNAKYMICFDIPTSGAVTTPSAKKTIPYGSYGTTGCDIALGQIGWFSQYQDLVFIYVDDLGTGNLRFKIGRDLNYAGDILQGWTDYISVDEDPANTLKAAGIAMANIDFDGGSRPDLVCAALTDNTAPDGGDQFAYKIAWNLDYGGVPTGWTGWEDGPRTSIIAETDGMGVACANINGVLGTVYPPEIFCIWIDDVSGANSIYYEIEWESRVYGSH